MKKIVLITLLCLMPIFAIGCGNDNKQDCGECEKYADLIDAIEDGDEILAKEELEKFFSHSSSGDGINDSDDSQLQGNEESEKESEQESEEDSELESEIDPAVVAFQKIVACEWKPDKWSVRNKNSQPFILYEDGTCDMFGESLRWKIEDVEETSQKVIIYRGDEEAYWLYISKNKETGIYSATVSNRTEKEVNDADKYYATSNLSVLEITIDNWQEYFEVTEIVNMDYDAFGDPYRYYVSTFLRLKDEFGYAINDISHVAVEYSYYRTSKKVFIDYETKEYTLEDLNVTTEKYYHTNVYETQDWYMGDEIRYGIEVVDFYLDCAPEQTASSWEVFDGVKRMQGYIYVISE